jgi:predicted ATPase
VLAADRSKVALRAEAVTTDVQEFDQLLKAAAAARSDAGRQHALAAAVALYKGELLPGHYEDWVMVEQERLAGSFRLALRQLGSHYHQLGDLPHALDCAFRAVREDPLNEEAHCDLIRLYLESGDRSSARRQYYLMAERLSQELGSSPGPEARALLQRVESSPATAPLLQLAVPKAASRTFTLPAGTISVLGLEVDCSLGAEGGRRELDEPCQRLESLCAHALRQHGGRPLRSGPGALSALFARATDAVACAVSVHRALAGHRCGRGVEQFHVRAAVGTEEVAEGVNWQDWRSESVASLLAAAHSGQILCSSETMGLVRRSLEPGIGLLHLGAYHLAGRPEAEAVFQVTYPGMARRRFPSPKARASGPGSLPLQVTRFIGREDELALVCSTLLQVETWLLTITGPGGCGKTRLAAEAADRLRELFPGAVWFVPLVDARDPASCWEALRRSLDLSEAEGDLEALLSAASQALLGRPCLVVVDNTEQVVDCVAEGVMSLRRRLPQLKLLVTSRRPLAVEGEREIALGPLGVPPREGLPSQLARYESIRLFVDRAQAARPGFQLTAANSAAVAGLCRRLDGLPLALELAAARSQVFTPSQMLASLMQNLDLLASHRRDLHPRHRSLRAALDWSVDMLPPHLRAFFHRLATLSGSFTATEAETALQAPLALDWLLELRDHSLVTIDDALTDEPFSNPTEARFRLLDTVRQYAADKLREPLLGPRAA